ncbi:acyl-CoA dehydrogenase family protein [Rhodococcus sp. IEGM 1318]|uniref:acyl-CoA dehydrogenase family protein n=1 Tax=Rhodococcus sp. IEGM 1318 TaxID=3082226 RepID=UPI002953FF61|nr:acyl-CoA dehydrogenase family protein [Rhodococcus sp. IEGM 1318]MDV8003816.1 acyl-CoA dehydrogenase family protein [Rhodococcus sp. IEGM 1318]
MTKWPELAREIADTVLFPVADSVDADGEIPSSHFDALAADGFYGIAALGEGGPNSEELVDVLETLCGGCLATTFTWMQHHGVVGALASSSNISLREQYWDGLVSGTIRGGVAYAGAIPRPPLLWAKRVNDGYVLDGIAPFVTGWGIVDVLVVSARDEFDNSIVHSVVPVGEAPGLTIEELPLIAARGSNTVRIVFDAFEIPDTDVCSVVSDEQFQSTQLPGLWLNGAMAMGITRRAVTELADLGVDAGVFEEQAARARADLDAALRDGGEMSAARARASELAIRASAALVTATGSRALVGSNTPERLMREATFTLVAAGRPEIKTALVERLSGY